MRAVWSWLSELVELDRKLTATEAAAALTGAGLEVEGYEDPAAGFSGVVIARVVAKRPHPHADRLTLVEVTDNAEGTTTEVVCGAPNVPEPGGFVCWGKPGAKLPGGFELAPREIKGVVSAGMLCSETELGIGDDDEGIIVLTAADVRDPAHLTPGVPVADALSLSPVFEISAPANRPDVLGHVGIARELAAIVGGKLRLPSVTAATETTSALSAANLVSVQLADPDKCTRYVARVIDGVTVRPSPRWLRQRLRGVGVRPLSNLVDITNYVMFELGQPLHAFDYRQVAGARIEVRGARRNESITTLDEIERPLLEGELLICDGERGVALAGVMGGLNSEVADDTSRVLLESASFEPRAIRRTARRVGLHSESSHRFERGVDPDGCDFASARAAALMAELGGGQVAKGHVDIYPAPAKPTVVSYRPARASALTGIEIDATKSRTVFERLGLSVDEGKDGKLIVSCPSFRPDLVREVDLIEEIVRIHGFHDVPATLPATPVELTRVGDDRGTRARRALTAAGMSEAITFGFTSPARIAALGLPADDRRARPVPLRNPMSLEQSVMRTSLLPNLLGAVVRNVSYGVGDVALFEVGSVFLRKDGGSGEISELPDEPTWVAGVLAGTEAGWLAAARPVDFFDLKGRVEALLAALLPSSSVVEFRAASGVSYLHPGVTAAVFADGQLVGHAGEVHPSTRDAFDLDRAVFAFELDLGGLPAASHAQMHGIPRFPSVSRDVSFLVDRQVPASRVRALVEGMGQEWLERLTILEDFRDPVHVPEDKKGMLWSFTYRAADRTLTDAEVDPAHEGLVAKLFSELDAVRR